MNSLESVIKAFTLTGENPQLIHNITNYVTVNDCANILLAMGSSPIMADDPREVAEIAAICSGLVINIGTLNERTIESMIIAGKTANRLNHPVVLDPVGAGASLLRTETTYRLLDEVKFSVIRGNISEILTVAKGAGRTRGVDADAADMVTEGNMDATLAMATDLAKRTSAIVAITGPMDLITDGKETSIVKNGNPEMSKITGTGCMLSAMTAAYVAANPNELLSAAVCAVATMGIAGELAAEKVTAKALGTGSLRTHIIDAISQMTPQCIETHGKISFL